MTWTVQHCDDCNDGWIYCFQCEGICDHDAICPKCKGGAWFPRKATFIDTMIGVWLYRTRRDASASIDLERC